jgi:DUF1365 family protein
VTEILKPPLDLIQPVSGLYIGRVGHSRTRPAKHMLSYSVFMLLLDLDEVPALARSLHWFSLGRFNLASFDPHDYGDGSATPLRTQVERRLGEAGLTIDGGPIRLLCLPRVLGYVFNPISVYFCYRPNGALAAILYEVSSTFGERHSYLIPAEPDADGEIRQSVQKRLHVSPFMDMDLRYAFRVTPPGPRVRIAIEVSDTEGTILNASFIGARRALTDAQLLRAWVSHPFLTLKVIAAIHWEAVKIVLKGVRLRSRHGSVRGCRTVGVSEPLQP